jgi:hypothetical protein
MLHDRVLAEEVGQSLNSLKTKASILSILFSSNAELPPESADVYQ